MARNSLTFLYICLNAALAAFFWPLSAISQFYVINPPSIGASMPACIEYSRAVLNNPWDMSDSADINNYIPSAETSGMSAMSFSGGLFQAQTSTRDPYFFLLTPAIPSSIPVGGRWGSDFPIDSSRFHVLMIKMFTDTPSKLQVIWYTDYDRCVAAMPIPTVAGWNVYTIDLNTVARLDCLGPNIPWNSATVRGLRIDPSEIAGAQIAVDWINLNSGENCGSYQVEAIGSALSGEEYYNLYLDDDGDPWNGYVRQLAAAVPATGRTASYNASAEALPAGNYYVNGFLNSDFATLFRSNPWDMNGADDLIVTFNIVPDGASGFNNGSFGGTSSSASPQMFLNLGSQSFSASEFSKLSVKMSQSSPSPIQLVWNFANSVTLDPGQHDVDGDGVYHLDLAKTPGWSGSISNLELRPAGASGVHFNVDFVQLRSSGFVVSDALPTASGGIGVLRVQGAPLMKFLQPDAKGGEAVRPWNMSATSDIQVTQNLYASEILPFNEINGLIGDFFHGSNLSGNDDPVNYSSFHTVDPVNAAADVYHNLTYRLYVTGAVDLEGGSVARVYWAPDAANYGGSQDIIVFGGWNEYTLDMLKAPLEASDTPWAGVIKSLRVDAHEFKAARDYYFDYVQLRKDDYANSKFAIVYEIGESEGATGSVALYYNTAQSTDGGTLIATLPLQSPSAAYIWDTSTLAPGDYYLYAVASNGMNSTARLATGKLVVTRDWTDDQPPILSLEAPFEDYQFDSWIQLKGYALDRIQVAQVEVYIDDVLFAALQPSLFHPTARDAYRDYADSSNAGFNSTFSVQSLPYGRHELKVAALDTAGNYTALTRTIFREAGVDPQLLSDRPPDGVALPVAATYTPPLAPRIQSAAFDRRGAFTLKISRLSAGCGAAILAGSSGSPSDVIKSFTVGVRDQAGASFKARRLPAFRKKIYLRVSQDCAASGKTQSRVKTLRSLTRGKTAYSRLLSLLKKKLRKI